MKRCFKGPPVTMRYVTLFSFFLQCTALSAAGAADKVALLPLRYEEVGAQTAAADCAPCRARVRQEIRDGLLKDSHELVPLEVIRDAAARVSLGDEAFEGCRDDAGLGRIADELGASADRVVCVWVRDETKESATYAIRVAAAPGGAQESTGVGGLERIASDVSKMVLEVLNRPAQPEADEIVAADEDAAGAKLSLPPPSPPEPAPAEPVAEKTGDEAVRDALHDAKTDRSAPVAEDKPGIPAPTQGQREGGLGKAPFWISAAVTGCLGAGFVTTELLASSIYADLRREEDPQKWRLLRDDFNAVQTADRVLLGLFAAGAVTTVVLGVLTNFGGEPLGEKEGQGVRAAPVVTGERAGVIFYKRF